MSDPTDEEKFTVEILDRVKAALDLIATAVPPDTEKITGDHPAADYLQVVKHGRVIDGVLSVDFEQKQAIRLTPEGKREVIEAPFEVMLSVPLRYVTQVVPVDTEG
jgi:hypothetical protein